MKCIIQYKSPIQLISRRHSGRHLVLTPFLVGSCFFCSNTFIRQFHNYRHLTILPQESQLRILYCPSLHLLKSKMSYSFMHKYSRYQKIRNLHAHVVNPKFEKKKLLAQDKKRISVFPYYCMYLYITSVNWFVSNNRYMYYHTDGTLALSAS